MENKKETTWSLAVEQHPLGEPKDVGLTILADKTPIAWLDLKYREEAEFMVKCLKSHHELLEKSKKLIKTIWDNHSEGAHIHEIIFDSMGELDEAIAKAEGK